MFVNKSSQNNKMEYIARFNFVCEQNNLPINLHAINIVSFFQFINICELTNNKLQHSAMELSTLPFLAGDPEGNSEGNSEGEHEDSEGNPENKALSEEFSTLVIRAVVEYLKCRHDSDKFKNFCNSFNSLGLDTKFILVDTDNDKSSLYFSDDNFVKDISEEHYDCVKVIMTAIRELIKDYSSCDHVSNKNFLEYIKYNQELITEILEKNERN